MQNTLVLRYWPLAMLMSVVFAVPAQAFNAVLFNPAPLEPPTDLDAAVGIPPGTPVEDFEDTTLVNGLTYTDPVTGTVLNTLPNLFSRNELGFGGTAFWIDDPWDGDHVLSNYTQNLATTSNGDLSGVDFRIAAGSDLFFVGISNLQSADMPLAINGVGFGSLGGGPNFTKGLGHNAFLRIEREPGDAPITSVRFTPPFGDSVTFDHLAFASVPAPVPTLYPLAFLALALMLAATMEFSRNGANAPHPKSTCQKTT